MQPEPSFQQSIHFRAAVKDVSDDWKARVGQMYPDLMAAAGARCDPHQRRCGDAPDRLYDHDGDPPGAFTLLTRAITERHFFGINRMMCDRVVQLQPGWQVSCDQGFVSAEDFSSANRGAQLRE